MSVKIEQTCDRCGSTRPLAGSEPHQIKNNGWRELTSGSLRATVCNVCLRTLILAWQRQTGIEVQEV